MRSGPASGRGWVGVFRARSGRVAPKAPGPLTRLSCGALDLDALVATFPHAHGLACVWRLVWRAALPRAVPARSLVELAETLAGMGVRPCPWHLGRPHVLLTASSRGRASLVVASSASAWARAAGARATRVGAGAGRGLPVRVRPRGPTRGNPRAGTSARCPSPWTARRSGRRRSRTPASGRAGGRSAARTGRSRPACSCR